MFLKADFWITLAILLAAFVFIKKSRRAFANDIRFSLCKQIILCSLKIQNLALLKDLFFIQKTCSFKKTLTHVERKTILTIDWLIFCYSLTRVQKKQKKIFVTRCFE